MTAEEILKNAETNAELEPCTVYYVNPSATRHPIKRVAECEHDGDAEAIAKFLRDRDGIYTYAYTDDSCTWTVLEALFKTNA